MARKKKRITPLTKGVWFLQYLAFQVGMALIRVTPLSLVYRTGHKLGGIAHGKTRKYRNLVRKNLQIVTAGQNLTDDQIDHLTKQVFQRTGANLFSALKTATLSEQELAGIVEFENLHLVEEATSQGKGLIFLLAHMGNWELIAQIATFLPQGVRGGTHYRPLKNPFINRAIEAQRSRLGTKLFAKRASTHLISQFIREGNVVGILSDQRTGSRGDRVNFFGKEVPCTPMPALLAKRTGAKVLALSVSTAGIGKWRMKIHPIDGLHTTANFMKALEEALRESPTDGFWFQDRWRS